MGHIHVHTTQSSIQSSVYEIWRGTCSWPPIPAQTMHNPTRSAPPPSRRWGVRPSRWSCVATAWLLVNIPFRDSAVGSDDGWRRNFGRIKKFLFSSKMFAKIGYAPRLPIKFNGYRQLLTQRIQTAGAWNCYSPLVPRLELVDLYLHSPTSFHAVRRYTFTFTFTFPLLHRSKSRIGSLVF
jgi:hypothetical protein